LHFRDGRIDRLRTFTNREEALEAAEQIRSAAPAPGRPTEPA
jgi:hypothetical protein